MHLHPENRAFRELHRQAMKLRSKSTLPGFFDLYPTKLGVQSQNEIKKQNKLTVFDLPKDIPKWFLILFYLSFSLYQNDPRCVFLCDENVGNFMETLTKSLQTARFLVPWFDNRQGPRLTTVFSMVVFGPKNPIPQMFSPQKTWRLCVDSVYYSLCWILKNQAIHEIQLKFYETVHIKFQWEMKLPNQITSNLCPDIVGCNIFFCCDCNGFPTINHVISQGPTPDILHGLNIQLVRLFFFPCAKGSTYHSFKIFWLLFLNPMLFIYSRKVQHGTKFNTWFACLCKHIQVPILTTLYLFGFYCNQHFYVPIIFNCSFGRLAIHLPRPHHQGSMNAERYDQLGWPWHGETWWIWQNKCDLCQCNHPFSNKWQWVVS